LPDVATRIFSENGFASAAMLSHVERAFTATAKLTHWGKLKLKRDT
jgi:hypothetical protein